MVQSEGSKCLRIHIHHHCSCARLAYPRPDTEILQETEQEKEISQKETEIEYETAYPLPFVLLVHIFQCSSRTVLREIESNNGDYIAEVGTSKSLFGTKTVINVRKAEPETGLIIGGFYKKPITVYEGEEYVALNAKVSWDEFNDDVLILNGTALTVSFE